MRKLTAILFPLLVLSILASCQGRKIDPHPAPVNDSLAVVLQQLDARILADSLNHELYYERAMFYMKQQKAQPAYDDLLKAISLNSQKTTYYLALSDACLALGRAKEAKSALEKAVSIAPGETEALLKLAELSLYFKDYDRVFLYTDQALQIRTDLPRAYFIRGFALKEKGDTNASIISYQKAVSLDQSYYDAMIQLGLLHAAKRNKLAVEYYTSALQLRPNSSEALYNLGMYYQETEDFNKAMDAYRKIMEIEPGNKYAHFNMGYIHLFYLRVYNLAAKHFSDALKIDPSYAEAMYNRGYCYELMGDVMNARQDYLKAMELRPGYALPSEGLKRLERDDKNMIRGK